MKSSVPGIETPTPDGGAGSFRPNDGKKPRPARRSPGSLPLDNGTVFGLAVAFGICGGYADMALIFMRKAIWNEELSLHNGRDFLWTVPVSHIILLLFPAFFLALVVRIRPSFLSARSAAWLYATLALWSGMLRLPLYGLATFLLALGLGRPISGATVKLLQRRRGLRSLATGLLSVLVVFGVVSTGRDARRKSVGLENLAAVKLEARNVILIVLDTVRAYNLSTYGYARQTSPNLTRLARQGVQYKMAAAAAPWTYPSHCSIFTGEWPFRLNSQWKFALDSPEPTLAEYLSAKGYQTAGFAANTFCCNYETGLARGFEHYEDFPLTPRSLISRTAPGKWILMHLLYRGNYYDMKWIDLQSQGVRGTNQAFLNWLQARRRDLPFFAFLNYYEAHDPYIPPPEFEGRFGIPPSGPRDHNFLFNYVQMDKETVQPRDIELARDSYDSCIAFLDEQLGLLIDLLRSRRLLENTVVIITSDHGEAFGDHKLYGHSNGLYLDEIGVPLVILSPDAPAGKVVDQPVSLCDLPATILEQLGLVAGSPFKGRSLSAYWHEKPQHEQVVTTPAVSELATVMAFDAKPESGGGHIGYQLSLVASGHHYLRDGAGAEALFDLKSDPFEQASMVGSAVGQRMVSGFRKTLAQTLHANPATVEVEAAYMKHFREELDAQLNQRAGDAGSSRR